MNSTDDPSRTTSIPADSVAPAGAPTRPAPRARSVWLAVAVFLFVVQLVTGLLMMTVYSPSTATAWGSVWYIQTVLPSGAFIRGLHHFASDAMLIVLAFHALQLIVTRGFAPPRGAIWAITLLLLGLTLAISLTGELLPWDQAGYWGTKVRLNILARTPRIGDALRRLLIGGGEFGQLTLARFHALHVIVLPTLLALLFAWRARMTRRVDERPASSGAPSPANPYFSAQRLRDSLACAAVLGVVGAVIWYSQSVLGSNLLDAPADPTTSDYPARPEWHTLFLYQWLKYFSGGVSEVVGAIVIPGFVTLVFFALPAAARVFRERWGRRLALGVTIMTLAAGFVLTLAALWADRKPPDERVSAARAKQGQGEKLSAAEEAVIRADDFQKQKALAAAVAARAFELASQQGIPPSGPLGLLDNDPMTRGPVLFAAHCASCHRYDGRDGLGRVPVEPATSSDLAGYATREWIRSLLADPMADRHFGRMTKPDGEPAHTRMSKWTSEQREGASSEEARRKLSDDFDAAAAYLADESIHPGRLATLPAADETGSAFPAAPEEADEALIRRGRRFFMAVCNECHSYQGERWGTFNAPEMFGYGSVAWIQTMIADPSDDARYRSRGREPAQMPAFKDRLSEGDRALIARWLFESRGVSRAGVGGNVSDALRP